MNDEAVYRTAPATPGLLIILTPIPGVSDQAADRVSREGPLDPQTRHQPGGLRPHEPQLHQVKTNRHCLGLVKEPKSLEGEGI